MWNDKLYAATKNTNVQLLWYDRPVTPEPPKTWREMIDMAKKLKAEGKPYQILFTGAQYEGLVVTYNTLVASAGGKILSDDGKSVVMDEGAVEALEMLKEVASRGHHRPVADQRAGAAGPAGVLERQDSKAAFELNWPYVYAAMQDAGNPDRAKNFKWARYPGVDGPSRVTIGGYNLGGQRVLGAQAGGVRGGAVPAQRGEPEVLGASTTACRPRWSRSTRRALIATPGVSTTRMDRVPDGDTIQEELEDPAVRPLTVVYQNLSTITSKVLSPPPDIDPEATADELREQLQKASSPRGFCRERACERTISSASDRRKWTGRGRGPEEEGQAGPQ